MIEITNLGSTDVQCFVDTSPWRCETY